MVAPALRLCRENPATPNDGQCRGRKISRQAQRRKRSHLSKHRLMLSAATVALLTGQAFADTTITKATTDPLTTGTLPSGAKGTGSAGNIIVSTGGSIAADNTGAGAVTI